MKKSNLFAIFLLLSLLGCSWSNFNNPDFSKIEFSYAGVKNFFPAYNNQMYHALSHKVLSENVKLVRYRQFVFADGDYQYFTVYAIKQRFDSLEEEVEYAIEEIIQRHSGKPLKRPKEIEQKRLGSGVYLYDSVLVDEKVAEHVYVTKFGDVVIKVRVTTDNSKIELTYSDAFMVRLAGYYEEYKKLLQPPAKESVE